MSEGEFRRAWPIATAYASILASLYVLKPARNSLFLTAVGADFLPYVLLLAAGFGAATALVFARVTRSVPVPKLVVWILPVLGVCLVGFRFLLSYPTSVGAFGFYVWVNLYGHLSTALFWLLANAVFDAREARRVFGFIGALGIAGAVLGGVLTQQVSEHLGTLDLLWVTVALQLVALSLLRGQRVRAEPPKTRRAHALSREASPEGNIVSDLRDNRLLRVLALLALSGAIVSAVVDVQFNIVVDEIFASRDEKTAFFGLFFAVLNAVAFLFQLFASPRILTRWGLAPALLMLPSALALGAGGLLLLPTLSAAVWLKASDIGIRHSLYKSAFEILFVPLRSEVKKRAKVFLDATVDNVGTGVGALLILLLLDTLGVGYRWLSVLTLAVVSCWLFWVMRAKDAYVEAFRKGLERREIHPEDLAVQLRDPVQQRPLLDALQSGNARQIHYALDMLSGLREPGLVEPLLKLLQHDDPDLRSKALNVLGKQRGIDVSQRVEPLLHDPSPDVRREAMYLLAIQSGNRQEVIGKYLKSADPELQGAALGCIAQYLGAGGHKLLTVDVQLQVLEHQGPEAVHARAELARALAAVGEAAEDSVLLRLAEDEHPRVVSEAIRALGTLADPHRVEWLIAQLEDRRYRRAATAALSDYGGRVVERLAEVMLDPTQKSAVRAAAPRVLLKIGSQDAASQLMSAVKVLSPSARLPALKAASKLRATGLRLEFSSSEVRAALQAEAEWFTGLLLASTEAAEYEQIKPGDAGQLLLRALREKREETTDRIFRLLALIYPAADIYAAYLGTRSSEVRRRARALEFLDNLVEREDKQFVFPFVEPRSPEECLKQARQHFAVPKGSGLGWLLRCSDAWLRACTLFAATPAFLMQHTKQLARLCADSDSIVSEIARSAQAQLSLDPSEPPVSKRGAAHAHSR